MGRRKHKINAIKSPSCSVCQVSSSSSFIPRCSSCSVLSRPTLCDTCFHRHIFTTISRDITSRVICPEQNCNAELTKEIIQAALAASGNQSLWEEYLSKFNWRGTSERWIKSFSVRCPGCLVPIEKNGGCDHMVCAHCKIHFNWHLAKISNMTKLPIWWRRHKSRIATIFYRCLTVVFMLFFVKFLLFHQERLISMVNNFFFSSTIFFYYILDCFT
jgi:hypothetical protein